MNLKIVIDKVLGRSYVCDWKFNVGWHSHKICHVNFVWICLVFILFRKQEWTIESLRSLTRANTKEGQLFINRTIFFNEFPKMKVQKTYLTLKSLKQFEVVYVCEWEYEWDKMLGWMSSLRTSLITLEFFFDWLTCTHSTWWWSLFQVCYAFKHFWYNSHIFVQRRRILRHLNIFLCFVFKWK